MFSADGVVVDKRIQAVKDYPIPKTKQDIRFFLGMANKYRKFIPNYSKLASPLSSLLKKDAKFEWSELCQSSIKQALTSTPALAYPNTEKPFILTCDASDYAIGYTLSQITAIKNM